VLCRASRRWWWDLLVVRLFGVVEERLKWRKLTGCLWFTAPSLMTHPTYLTQQHPTHTLQSCT
jgi:hypothetical protein